MKKIIFKRNLKKLLILSVLSHTLAYGQLNVPKQENNAFRNDLDILLDETSLNQHFMRLKKSGSVHWNSTVTKAGYYDVKIRFRAFNGSKEQFLIKNNDTIPIGFSMSEQWSEFSQAFHFNKGENKIGLAASWGNMDIDWLMLTKTKTKLDISPKKQEFIKEIEQPLVFKIDNYHQEIKRVLLNGKPIDFSIKKYPYQESSVWLILNYNQLNSFSSGNYSLKVELNKGKIYANVAIKEKAEKANLIFVVPNVEHGSSVLVRLPSGKNLLIDSGKNWVRDSILVPMLVKHQIDTIHTFIITHYHGDHDSGDKGAFIKKKFNVQQFIDRSTFSTGTELRQDGVTIKFLNGTSDGDEENSQSLAFKISYNGFNYFHSADNYATNQLKILKTFPNDIKSNVFYGNHHFHGSLLPDFVVKANPDIVLVQSQEAVYARSAYMDDYKNKAVKVINAKRKSPVETLLALEVGATVILVNTEKEWWYRTQYNQNTLFVPELLNTKK
jgi:beta-lactamase superfamily II metal-dependent hydrolase